MTQGRELSPAGEVLVEESIEGWKEYEMEVMRDRAGNGIIVCSNENLDPMGVHTGDSITVAPAQTLSDLEYQRMRAASLAGVHTGDSITVAPAQTLSDLEYQRMRAASLAILEKIGVETGGSNVQFAVNPQNGRLIVIEMNPRVSRSSASPSLPRRPCPISSTSACAPPPWRFWRRSASRRVARTCSSRSTPKTDASSSSR